MAVSASVFSSQWYRVAALRPVIADSVRVERQPCRGELWHVLHDVQSGRSLRLNGPAYAIAGRLTGGHSVQQVWERACTELGDDAPSQDECIAILAQLHEAGLLQADRAADFDAIHRQRREQAAHRTASRRNPLAWRIRLGDPTSALTALDAWGPRLFCWPMLVVWSGCIVLATLLAASHWSALTAHASKWLGTPRYWLIAFLLYPALKALHELAHGVSIRRFGGEVRSFGVTLMLGVPLPFVDAQAASCLPRAWQRALVSAAGIMAELFVAGLGLFAWLLLEPGTARDVAFVAAFVGTASTLLFNANPLLKFDGYFLLTDAFALPNLASRSARYWRARCERLLLRVPRAPEHTLAVAAGERGWLEAYGPMSLAYRIALAYAIFLWVGAHSVVVALALAALVAIQMLTVPMRMLRDIAAQHSAAVRARAIALTVAVITTLALGIGWIPLPFAAVAQGVVWMAPDAELRAQSEGFIANFPVADGMAIEPGQIVAVLDNPTLLAEVTSLRARIGALETELFDALRGEAVKAQDAADALEQARAELLRAEEKLQGLELRAGAAGRLVMPRQADMLGAFVRKGDSLGYVLSAGGGLVRVAVPEGQAETLRSRTRAVTARLTGAPGAVAGELVRDGHAASRTLPSPALGSRHGGALLADPEDEKGRTAAEAVVVLEVRVPAAALAGRIGQRAWIRFDHGAAPLAEQWGRRLRQALLRHFDPSG